VLVAVKILKILGKNIRDKEIIVSPVMKELVKILEA
jgi:hypothetical protein